MAVFFLVCFLSAVAPKALFLKDSGSVRYVGYSENSVISLLLGNEIRALPLLEKDLKMVHIFRTGPLRCSTKKIPISKPVT